MNFDRKKACNECPFRSTCLPGVIGPYQSPTELVISAKESDFSCHTGPGKGDPSHPEAQACYGAAVMARKSASLSRDPHVASYQIKVGKNWNKKSTPAQDEIMDQWDTIRHHTP